MALSALALGKECGLTLAGFAGLETFESQYKHFTHLGSGDIAFSKLSGSGLFGWKAIMPNAKSIISVALAYKQTIAPSQEANKAKISMSAYGIDYHKAVMAKASRLVEKLQAELGTQVEHKIFVDTGPLSDKMAAYSAGLGFIGRNSLLVNEEYGSFIFLGTILVDAELEANDRLIESKCPECGLCVAACPTGALDSGFAYSKCISYQSQIGKLSRKAAGSGYIYGCDECQLCCPYNIAAPEAGEPSFLISLESAYADLNELASITNSQFKAIYGNSAMSWRGAAPIRRNAIKMLDVRDNSERK
ncbi:MAG: tRNA epoxyqueuosine(34) reductase QueG [Eubacteriaceae bacterium]|nr:tRNA epoxyqueuosine(34) reductase QueG [Eubacteriaceae bacterium]